MIPLQTSTRSASPKRRLSSLPTGTARMLSWLTKGKSKAKDEPVSGLEHGHIEPIFDADPPLYFLYPHAKLPGSTAPKVMQFSAMTPGLHCLEATS